MLSPTQSGAPQRWRGTTAIAGIACAGSAYLMFTMQDAVVKWLVTDYAVVQLLFIRSVIIVALCLVSGGTRAVREAAESPAVGTLLMRAGLMLVAWLCYFTAARSLGLAELISIYFVAPLIVAILAGPVLGEQVRKSTWVALVIGFCGIIVITNPTSPTALGAAALTLLSAGLWAYTTVLGRRLAVSESTTAQVLTTNVLFLVVCGLALPWAWRMPEPTSLGLMLVMGLLAGAGQVLLTEGLRRTPVAVASCLEFTALPWSLALAFLIWGDRPTITVCVGVGLVLASGALVFTRAWRPA
ncbi:MAG: DMT family transporter [Azospirillaceae bacterium]|nr:DMT family transporter [Azospirillaceae bacterium]